MKYFEAFGHQVIADLLYGGQFGLLRKFLYRVFSGPWWRAETD